MILNETAYFGKGTIAGGSPIDTAKVIRIIIENLEFADVISLEEKTGVVDYRGTDDFINDGGSHRQLRDH